MTNKHYHRRRRALERLSSRRHLTAEQASERATLSHLVGEYRKGGLRPINGKGAKRHPSGAAA